MLEGFLVLVLILAVGFGLYSFATSYQMIPIWAYPAAVGIAIVSYVVGRVFEVVA